MVSKRVLVGISAFVWLCAGLNIFRLGALEYAANLSVLCVALTVLIFLLFGTMFFRIVSKNLRRIVNLPVERNGFWHFFTPRMYVLIVGMMSFGIFLRNWSAVPRFFIAFFYVGLGAGLALAGVRYAYYFIRYRHYEPLLRTMPEKG